MVGEGGTDALDESVRERGLDDLREREEVLDDSARCLGFATGTLGGDHDVGGAGSGAEGGSEGMFEGP